MKKFILLLIIPFLSFSQTPREDINFQRANTDYQNKKYRSAITHFQRIVSPDYFVYHMMARCYREIGKYEQSIQNYKTSIRMKPDYVNNYIGLSWVYAYYVDEYKLALQTANTGMSYDRNIWQFYYNKGYAHAKLSNYEEAIVCYDKHLELYRGSEMGNGYNLRGFCKLFSFSSRYTDHCSDFKIACEFGSINGCRNYKNAVCEVDGIFNPNMGYIYFDWEKNVPPKHMGW